MQSANYTYSARLALAACVMAVLPAAVMANNTAKDLAKVEARGVAAVGTERMASLASPAKLNLASAKGGRAPDVVFSRAWLASQPKATGSADFSCLAEALYFEARGETVKGQFAVAEVIRNRVKSSRFPNSYCAVINQGTGKKHQCQFSYTCDGHPEVIAEHAAYARVAKVARATIDGRSPDITKGATFYHTTSVRPSWASKFTNTARFGVHLFYSRGVRTASN